MKNILKLSGLLFLMMNSLFINAQNENELNRIINESLKDYVETLEAFYEKNGFHENFMEEHYINTSNHSKNFEFDSYFQKYKFIDASDVSSFTRKKLKKGILVISYSGATLDQDTLVLWFIRYGVTKKRRHINKEYGSGTQYTYKYSCEEKRWIFLGKKGR